MLSLNRKIMGLFLLSPVLCYAQQSYVVPPSQSTTMHVPVISDELAEKCVEIYNQSKWLEEDLDKITVDQYSQASVDNYNAKVNEINQLSNWFNVNCAGKQSYSACKAANKLNAEKGLPLIEECR